MTRLRPHPLRVLALLASVSAGAFSLAQTAPPAPPVSPAPNAAQALPDVPRLVERLVALHPSDPEAYFLLAEEVAFEATAPAHVRLAQTLYALAYELDRERGQTALGASCCLGLAATERSESAQLWLRALAGAIDRRYVQPDWSAPADGDAPGGTPLMVATIVGLVRAGEGALARERLDDHPDALAMLKKYEPLMGNTGERGGLSRLELNMSGWPCRECGNRRIVIKKNTDPPESVLCYTCNGNPGPILSRAELIAQLRFESRLLNGIQRSWAAQILSDFGATLHDPDPAELATAYDADPAKPLYRDGRWVADPAGAPAPVPAPPAQPVAPSPEPPAPDGPISDGTP